jgi:hypothetical protein
MASAVGLISLRLEEVHGGTPAAPAKCSDVQASSTPSIIQSLIESNGDMLGPLQPCKAPLNMAGQLQPQHPASLSLLRQSLAATLQGFQPQAMEEQYASWMARRCVVWINAWNVLFLSWVLACIVRSAREGDEAFWVHLPGHMMHLGPLVATGTITALRLYR